VAKEGMINPGGSASNDGPNPRRSAPGDSWASSSHARAAMQGNRSRDTQPELALRRAVHALGLRYRVHVAPVPALRRRADLVFTRAKVAVFVDGCYWHGCPQHYRQSQANSSYWSQKIAGNRIRDDETSRLLIDAGWDVVRIWEHEDALTGARVVRDRVADRIAVLTDRNARG
jgi:DNA mismatch endonuclease (patch repair protein)